MHIQNIYKKLTKLVEVLTYWHLARSELSFAEDTKDCDPHKVGKLHFLSYHCSISDAVLSGHSYFDSNSVSQPPFPTMTS